jgi:lipoprotein-releasing system permease protein
MFKGSESEDTVALGVASPSSCARKTGISPGDRMLTYFIGDRLKMRQFNVTGVHDVMVATDDNFVIYADMADLQRLAGWSENDVSAMEVVLDDDRRNEEDIHELTMQTGTYVNAYSSDSEAPVIAVSAVSRYPQIFDWLDLIDFNVFFILILMTIVAGFNMISGLLIMLFENISSIGLFKALGMTDRSIAKVFLVSSSVLVGKGMLAGNALALLFCLIQGKFHAIPLNPANYFVSFVPMDVNLPMILLADAAAFVIIMLLLMIPCLFITKVDPADTVRVK